MKANEFIEKLNELMKEYSRQNGVAIISIDPNPEILATNQNKQMLTEYDIQFKVEKVDWIK